MKATATTRNGQAVLQAEMSPQESERFHLLPVQMQHDRLTAAGFDLGQTVYMTNDSQGNVYYFQHV